MEGKRRGRAVGLVNGKLRWSLYRATAAKKLPPSSTAVLHQPEHLRPPHQSYNKIIVNHHQDHHQLTPQLPTHTRSLSTPDITNNTAVDSYTAAAKRDTLYGDGIAVDEAIDLKAANYISSVRDKFRLDYLA